MLYVVRVASKQERIVALMLEKKARTKGLEVYSILVPENVKGYLIIEVKDENTAINLVSEVKYVKGFLRSPITKEEVAKILTKAKEKKEEKIEIGDIVEIISGPFRGENAKVTQIDEAKKEFVVLPLDVAIAMPVKIKSSMVKLVKKAKEQ